MLVIPTMHMRFIHLILFFFPLFIAELRAELGQEGGELSTRDFTAIILVHPGGEIRGDQANR